MSSAPRKRVSPIYFPLEQGERATHLKANQLLARAVYNRLAFMLNESLPDKLHLAQDDDYFARDRGHSSIFLDGDRGSGKTTVVVNLPKYLQTDEAQIRYPGLADAIHVLKPIDPSQLEDGDDLFLNVVVAAVLGDSCVKAQRDKKPDLWRELHESLQSLGIALTGKETQSNGVGLDRLRAFMGTQELAGAVHDFFDKAAHLLGKRLLVLPIDDVDTTLHRAFENLEVVRRYLASPVLVPIVCGDLNLYMEVTWRDAFRRLTTDVAQYHQQAKPIAENLALEYLRKVLPLHRRLRMPGVSEYLNDDKVLLGVENLNVEKLQLTLPQLNAWLRALLAGPVNDHENSRLPIPIPTVRALSQLVSRVRQGIPALERSYFNQATTEPLTQLMQRISHVRDGKAAVRSHHSMVTETSRDATSSGLGLGSWYSTLSDHFMFEPNAGAVCLVLLAKRHWHKMDSGSVFRTPLFQPLMQLGHPQLGYIRTRAQLPWKSNLSGRLPDAWIEKLKEESILPFATPEIGRAVVPDRWTLTKEGEEEYTSRAAADLMIELITHHNFYSTSKRATLICSGRVLELLVTSLVRRVTTDDIERILMSTPFHSAVSVASTKEVYFSIDEIELGELDTDNLVEDVPAVNVDALELEWHREKEIRALALSINHWRRGRSVHLLPLSPWLIYCALNKTFNQAPIFTRPLGYSEQPKKESLSDVIASGLAAFNAFWAAVASFEKGPLFGQSAEISNVNLLNRRGEFSYNNLYTQNIRPLLEPGPLHASVSGESVISTTWTLQDHPLRARLQALFKHASELEESQEDEHEGVDGREYFLQALGLPSDIARITLVAVRNALRSNAPKGMSPQRFGKHVFQNVIHLFPTLPQLDVLQRAIEELESSKPVPGQS